MGSSSGFNIREELQVILRMRGLWNIKSVWLFSDIKGNKLSFDQMNDIFLDKMEIIKTMDTPAANDLSDYNIQEDFSINCLFRIGSSTAAQVAQIPTDIIELVNRWKKIKRSKGKNQSFLCWKLTLILSF